MSNYGLKCLILNRTEIYCFINMSRIGVVPDRRDFHLRVEINFHLFWFCITTLIDLRQKPRATLPSNQTYLLIPLLPRLDITPASIVSTFVGSVQGVALRPSWELIISART